MAEKTTYISVEEVERLRKADRELAMLRAHGVDNWDGYSEAMAELYPEDPDDLPF